MRYTASCAPSIHRPRACGHGRPDGAGRLTSCNIREQLLHRRCQIRVWSARRADSVCAGRSDEYSPASLISAFSAVAVAVVPVVTVSGPAATAAAVTRIAAIPGIAAVARVAAVAGVAAIAGVAALTATATVLTATSAPAAAVARGFGRSYLRRMRPGVAVARAMARDITIRRPAGLDVDRAAARADARRLSGPNQLPGGIATPGRPHFDRALGHRDLVAQVVRSHRELRALDQHDQIRCVDLEAAVRAPSDLEEDPSKALLNDGQQPLVLSGRQHETRVRRQSYVIDAIVQHGNPVGAGRDLALPGDRRRGLQRLPAGGGFPGRVDGNRSTDLLGQPTAGSAAAAERTIAAGPPPIESHANPKNNATSAEIIWRDTLSAPRRKRGGMQPLGLKA